MSPFMEMEWNAKWDWENLAACSKGIESPKNLQLVDWTIIDDGEIHVEPFNMSAGSSAKSSISASTDSSCKKIEINGIELSGTSPTPETSVGSAEALLGLKLGKRTYFENNNGNVKSTSFSVVPNPTITTPKKTRSSAQNAPICCQVEGCNADLLLAKEYHRKHRVCDAHSKCPKVIVEGRERRFCQQCSRFHGLCEFDERKRSCRRRLSDHNARRRKPHQETIQFNPPRLSASFYGGTQQMNFLNNSPVVESRALANSAWNSSRFTLTKGCSFKSDGDGVTDEIKALNMQNGGNGFLASKNPTSMVFNPVSKGSVMSLDPEYRRALSLLSSNSCGVQDSIQLPNENSSSVLHHGIFEGVLPEFWPHHQHQSLNADFYSNLLN